MKLYLIAVLCGVSLLGIQSIRPTVIEVDGIRVVSNGAAQVSITREFSRKRKIVAIAIMAGLMYLCVKGESADNSRIQKTD